MLIAITEQEGKKILVLGLQADNIVKLKNDEPIFKDLSTDPPVPGLEEWTICVLGPEDTVRFLARYG